MYTIDDLIDNLKNLPSEWKISTLYSDHVGIRIFEEICKDLYMAGLRKAETHPNWDDD